MRAVILNGVPAGNAAADVICGTFSSLMAEKGHEVVSFNLGAMAIAPCLGCFACWVKTPGECAIKDDGITVTRAMVNADMLVFLSPVRFGGYSFELKKALDRMIGLSLPFFKRTKGETHHYHRYGAPKVFMAVGIEKSRSKSEEKVFSEIVARNAKNFSAAAHSSDFVLDNYTPEILREKVKLWLGSLK
ncbi:MAG: flavodoxin family protein [Elusimicrobiaceae bacterium]